MVLRLSTTAARGAVLALTALVFCFLSFFSLRNAIAVHEAGLQREESLNRATHLEPSNPENWFMLGRYWQYNLENSDPARAMTAYRTALALNPRSADAWLDLAAALEAESDSRSAADAFIHAKGEYSASAEVAWRYGNFLLRQGENDAAFAEIRRSVLADPQRASEALSRCLRVDPNAESVLDRVIPPSSVAYLGIIGDFSDPEQLPLLLKVWERTVALHPKILFVSVFRFVEQLRQQGRTADAWRVWQQAAPLAGYPELLQPADSLLWDGGFESGVKNVGYAWRFAPNERRVLFQLDPGQHHSGRVSLRVGFDGHSNLSLTDACHSFPVQPGTTYRFSAWISSRDVTSDEGVRFLLRGQSNATPLVTPEIHGTNPWTKVEAQWTSPSSAREGELCLTRFPSDRADSKIRGTFWVDDVSIVPAAPERIAP